MGEGVQRRNALATPSWPQKPVVTLRVLIVDRSGQWGEKLKKCSRSATGVRTRVLAEEWATFGSVGEGGGGGS